MPERVAACVAELVSEAVVVRLPDTVCDDETDCEGVNDSDGDTLAVVVNEFDCVGVAETDCDEVPV